MGAGYVFEIGTRIEKSNFIIVYGEVWDSKISNEPEEGGSHFDMCYGREVSLRDRAYEMRKGGA